MLQKGIISRRGSRRIPWFKGWRYRKNHVINSAAGAGTNYQKRIKVHYGSGVDSGEDVYLGGKCRTDFGDIRFTDDDKITELDYWIQEKTDSDVATIWVEVKDDLGSNQTIYIYYGNAGASTTSNGANTFVFFDPCDNLDQWTKYTAGDGDVTIVDGTFKFKASGTGNRAKIKTALLGLANVVLAYKLKWVSRYVFREHLTPDDEFDAGWLSNVNSHLYRDEEYLPSYPNSHALWVNSVMKYSVFVGVRPQNQWDWIIRKSKSGKQALYYNDTLKDTQTETYDWEDLRFIMMVAGGIGTTPEYYVDDIHIRKFIDPEPAHGAWGKEERY